MAGIQPRHILVVYLSAWLINPMPIRAASAAVLGSVSSYGTVKLGDLAAPAENPLFEGDLVRTESGNALIQYKQGTRVVLAENSDAKFYSNHIELRSGEMGLHAVSADGPVFNASTLRLEPSAASSSANVSVQPGKVSVSVAKGAVRAVDPTGITLTVIEAGQTQLFAMANAAAANIPAPSSPAAAPPAMSPPTIWLLVLGGAAIAATTATILVHNANKKVPAVSPSVPQ